MKTFDVIEKELSFLSPDALMADGFEDALIGYCQIFNKIVSLYDLDKCTEILVERDGMSEEEAMEYLEFNVLGAYVGEHTPAYATIGRSVREL